MSESMNMGFEQQQTSAEVVVPKTEPQDENNNAIVASEKQIESSGEVGENMEAGLESGKKKRAVKAEEESDFDPENLTEADDDFSIPESERDSFASYERSRNSKRLQDLSKHRRSKYYVESEDDFFAELPRRKLKRACKTPASRAILRDADMESSTSPEEFDERIHVKVKSHDEKVAEGKKILKEREERRAAAIEEKRNKSESILGNASKDLTNADNAENVSKERVVEFEKAESVNDVEMGSPAKKVKDEPLDEAVPAGGDAKEHEKADEN